MEKMIVYSWDIFFARSLIEPIRRILSRLGGYYLEGKAEDIDFDNHLVEVAGVNASEGRSFYGMLNSTIIFHDTCISLNHSTNINIF
jgi:hypothetical protein